MLHRVLAVALAAGLLVGLAVAVLQHFVTTPLILAAEVYEDAEPAAPVVASQSGHGAPEHSHGAAAAPPTGAQEAEWKPADGLARTAFTGLATVATAMGFSLILLAGMLAAGDDIAARTALGWAAAAFVATGLAPAVGLAPTLPGSELGPLLARQAWWVGTALATGASLWMFVRAKSMVLKLAGVPLLLLPHILGAPISIAKASKVPAELAASFASASLMVQAVLWILCGLAVGVIWEWLNTKRTA